MKLLPLTLLFLAMAFSQINRPVVDAIVTASALGGYVSAAAPGSYVESYGSNLAGTTREIPLTNWIWPDFKQVQDLLRQRVMQAMVDGKGHTHESPLEIHADANAQREITTVQAQFPDEFQKMLVVAFRPNQLWVERKALSSAIKF